MLATAMLLSLCIVLPTACRRKPAVADTVGRPNIVLITIDTLRADHLSCYGYRRNTSPFLDSLAAKGTLFERAYATSSWTVPSMASIFTGLHPRRHGVIRGAAKKGRVLRQQPLPADVATLPEALKKAGYRTFGISSNGHMSEDTGFARGFDHFDLCWFDKSPAPNELALKHKDALAGESPFFLWVHYFDPHAPYSPREPWIEAYAESNRKECARWAGVQMRKMRRRIAAVRKSDAARRALVDMFDSEINYCDQHIERLFGELRFPENTIVVVTADHGEEFLEHNALGHGQSLFEEVVRVPLIVVLPAGRQSVATVPAPVSNRNILITLLDAAGLDTAGFPGHSLLPLIRNPATAPPEPVFLELDRRRIIKGIRSGDAKLICHDEDKCSLFDLERNPREDLTLAKDSRDPAVEDRLHGLLRDWMAENPAQQAPAVRMKVSPEQEEKLRSLGYIR